MGVCDLVCHELLYKIKCLQLLHKIKYFQDFLLYVLLKWNHSFNTSKKVPTRGCSKTIYSMVIFFPLKPSQHIHISKYLRQVRGVFWRFNPAGNFKVNDRNTRTRCAMCSKLTIKTSERPHRVDSYKKSVSFFTSTKVLLTQWML